MWRLGIDLGTNSLGWAALELGDNLEPIGVIALGSHIFSDGREPKTKESLAVGRRKARGMRRARDRKIQRISVITNALQKYNLPLDIKICPYKARTLAIHEKVHPEILARALFHLCQHRGFKSNRKVDGNDKENTLRKQQMSVLRNYLAQENLFIGEFLYKRLGEGLSTRFREGEHGVSLEYQGEKHIVYPERSLYYEEFQAIKSRQASDILSEEAWARFEHIIFFQRPLKPQQIGQCEFEDEERAHKNLPISQLIRIVQEVNNLRYWDSNESKALNKDQREKLIQELGKKKELSFKQIRKLLRLSDDIEFNLEASRDKLLGNETNLKYSARFKEYNLDWTTYPLETQNAIVQSILKCDDSELGLASLHKENIENWQLPKELLDKLMDISFPASYASLSVKAMQKILPHLLEGKLYYEAATEVYGGFTDLRHQTGELLDELPYYGEVLPKATSPIRKTSKKGFETVEEKYGRISNPTVHVALNRLRELVNALLVRFSSYGSLHEVHIELAKDLKLNKKEKERMLKNNREQEKANLRRKEELIACGYPNPSRDDLLKMRLWEELAPHGSGMGRMDIYTGKAISLVECMSENIEVEHILPFSQTYDNTMKNKSITFREVNREKGNKTPAEYAKLKGGKFLDEIVARAENLERSKKWRFQEDAMHIYEMATLGQIRKSELNERFEKGDQASFLARQLKDTQYMSVIASKYLVKVVGSPYRVIPVKGAVTGLLRSHWKLNFAKAKGTEDERKDHRHHAIDALIVALASRSMIKRIADHSRQEQERRKEYDRLYVPTPEILSDEKRVELNSLYNNILVSYKQDHSINGPFYQETAYGLVDEKSFDYKEGNAVVRRALTSLKPTEIEKIRDKTLRETISARLNVLQSQNKKFEEALGTIAQEGLNIGSHKAKVRHVRILVKNQSAVPIPSAPYKAYTASEYAYCDIWKVPKVNNKRQFTGAFTYIGSFVPYVDAMRYKDSQAELFKKYKPHPAAKHCMRLFKNDIVELRQANDEKIIMRVAGYSTSQNKLDVQFINTVGDGQNYKSINVLMSENSMRKISLSVDGRIMHR